MWDKHTHPRLSQIYEGVAVVFAAVQAFNVSRQILLTAALRHLSTCTALGPIHWQSFLFHSIDVTSPQTGMYCLVSSPALPLSVLSCPFPLPFVSLPPNAARRVGLGSIMSCPSRSGRISTSSTTVFMLVNQLVNYMFFITPHHYSTESPINRWKTQPCQANTQKKYLCNTHLFSFS